MRTSLQDKKPKSELIEAIRMLKNQRPENDIYIVITCAEEIGAHGACYAARNLPGDISIAIDVGPVASEYQTTLSPDPIVVDQDGVSVYDKAISDHLVYFGKKMKFNPQYAVFETYGSDASIAQSLGQSAKAALLCIPVENTHGFEITHKEALNRCVDLLHAYLSHPTPRKDRS